LSFGFDVEFERRRCQRHVGADNEMTRNTKRNADSLEVFLDVAPKFSMIEEIHKRPLGLKGNSMEKGEQDRHANHDCHRPNEPDKLSK
jgi:hypothetical protein